MPFEQPGAPRGQQGRREDLPRLEAGEEKVEDLRRAVTEEDLLGRDVLRARDEAPQVAGSGVRGEARGPQRLSHRVLRLAARPEGVCQVGEVEGPSRRDVCFFGIVVNVHVVVSAGREILSSKKGGKAIPYKDKERCLHDYQRPKRIEFYDALPRTTYGKYDKKSVKMKYWHGRDRMI